MLPERTSSSNTYCMMRYVLISRRKEDRLGAKYNIADDTDEITHPSANWFSQISVSCLWWNRGLFYFIIFLSNFDSILRLFCLREETFIIKYPNIFQWYQMNRSLQWSDLHRQEIFGTRVWIEPQGVDAVEGKVEKRSHYFYYCQGMHAYTSPMLTFDFRQAQVCPDSQIQAQTSCFRFKIRKYLDCKRVLKERQN